MALAIVTEGISRNTKAQVILAHSTAMVDRIQELRRRVAAEFARDVTSKAAEPALPEEVEEGNVEYKLQLLEPSAARLKQLTTQLHWRLNEGRGTAFYEVGVRDNGDPFGLSQDAMLQSLATLNR